MANLFHRNMRVPPHVRPTQSPLEEIIGDLSVKLFSSQSEKFLPVGLFKLRKVKGLPSIKNELS